MSASVEHHAVLMPVQARADDAGDPCVVVVLDPDQQGRVRPADLERALQRMPRDGPGLVSLAYVNNEVGAVLDAPGIAAVLARANAARAPRDRIWFHSDAVQAPGHASCDMGPGGPLAGVDFLTLSAHKFHGPPGVGVLVARSADFPLEPLLLGGHQQHGLRPGTEAVGAARALAAALWDATASPQAKERAARTRAMADAVWRTLWPFVVAGTVLLTGPPPGPERAPHHVSFCVRGVDRKRFVAAMDRAGVRVSSGSACTSDTDLPSHVLAAMRVPAEYIRGSVRITLAHTNVSEEVTGLLCPALQRLLALGPDALA